jgi:hypothetical protein
MVAASWPTDDLYYISRPLKIVFLFCIFAAKFSLMKKWQVIIMILVLCVFSIGALHAQCSICTKTASQLGEKPARGMNSGIIYLMLTPLAIASFIGFRWWKREQAYRKDESSE